MTRPTRYTENNSSRDWIDEFCATRSVEEVRGAFLFNMGKYQRRYGKKDDHLQEALKIQDYANRLVEYERSLVKPIIRELYSGGWTPEAVKQAAFPTALYTEATEERMDVVGQNGSTAEHYDQDPDWSKAPEGATHWGPGDDDDAYAAWYRKKDGEWECWLYPSDHSWGYSNPLGRILIPRPEHEWISTGGKKPDLPDGTLVDVKISDGGVQIGRSADLWIWEHDGASADITHYRIHHPK